jgi:Metallopeptidase family M24
VLGVNVLIWADTATSPALRHEVPVDIGGPFLYLEADGRRAVATNALEEARIGRAAPERPGVRHATVPPEFPLAIADRLRGPGIELTPDDGPFTDRRRHKTAAEMAGIRRATGAGDTLREGFYHGLRHGVGLQVHEAANLGRTGSEPLIAGDVIAAEPGTVVRGLGGVRAEDLLIVTDQGAESLTAALPFDLAP